VLSEDGIGLRAWLESDDTGQSSLYMVALLADSSVWIPKREHYLALRPYPLDPDDFGRCFRLLQAVPSLREHLPKLAEYGGDVWAAYIANWSELESLYGKELPTGRAPKLYDLMQTLQGRKR